MHPSSISSTEFSRNVATFLDQVRYTGESISITKGNRVVAELVPPRTAGLDIAELANLIATAPKLGTAASAMSNDLKKIRKTDQGTLENPWA